MTNGHSKHSAEPFFWSRWLVLCTLTSLAGCGGCFKSEDELSREELEKRAREKKESLEMSELVSLPADSVAKLLTVKPGHWHDTQQVFKSNREDMQVVAVESVGRGNDPAMIPGTNFTNEFTRRTSLPKGQSKKIDLRAYVPYSGPKADPFSTASTRLTFRTELLSWPLLSPILDSPDLMPANELKDHEFQLIALSPKALSYEYLTVLDAVYWRGDDLMGDDRTRSYYVALVKPDNNRYPLPRSMLTMTSTAVVVWDDVAPDNLSAAQQQALLDWVHWGGQLIVSGPSSWSRLRNSFLSPYLPARDGRSLDLRTEHFAAISERWAVPDVNSRDEPDALQIVGKPIGGLQLELAEHAQWLPGSGEMVAEAPVGRGRIVMTSYPMTEPRVYRWRYYSNFFSTGLLRRHPRVIRRTQEDNVLAQFWTKPYQNSEHDPRLHSNVRILTRDLPLSRTNRPPSFREPAAAGPATSSFSQSANTFNLPSSTAPSSEAMQWGGRGAAWNDYSGLSFQAIEALKAAAGIELPSRRTIVLLLVGYLLCLVPLNWCVFRLIGRLELAWVAAPILALLGVLVVTRVARLDIGFARRTTEIAVLELQQDHPRGHLTQYLALYTSLSTNYRANFPENDSVALPLGDLSRDVRRAGTQARQLRTNYGRSEGVQLEPLTVYSNSTEMIHAEQMVDLDGGLRLGNRSADASGPEAIRNDTGIDLQAALVVRRSGDGQLSSDWIGALAAGQSATLDFELLNDEQILSEWANDPVTQFTPPGESLTEGSEADALWIGGVLRELVRKTPLMPGHTKLFAFTNDRLSNLSLEPAEDQYDGRCLVVAHLTPMSLPDVVPDINIMSRRSSQLLDATHKEQLDEELKNLRRATGDPDLPQQ